MRVSLIIDGNATGAQKAANDASAAVSSVGKQADAVTQSSRAAGDAIANLGQRTEALAKEIEGALSKIGGGGGTNYLDAFSADLKRAVADIKDMSSVGQARLDELRAKYDPLFAVQQRYERELADLAAAFHAGALGEAEYGNALARLNAAYASSTATIEANNKALQGSGSEADVLSAIEKDLERAVADVNVQMVAARNGTANLANAHGGLSAQAMAAQHSIRSMIEQLALGMPPTQILTGQLNHLSFAATGKDGLSGAFKEATAAVTGFITPTTLLIAGVAALGTGFVVAASGVIKSTLALDDLSKSTDLSIGKLHQLQQATSFKGISQDDFTKGITAFADQVYEAQRNTGSLNALMIANGKSARDLEGYLSAVADLVARATGDMQKQKILREAGLPSDAAWVRFMEQGGASITAAMNSTVQFNEAVEKNMIAKAREFDDAWNKATTNLSNYLKGIVVDNLDWVLKVGKVIEMAWQLRQAAGLATAGVPQRQPAASLDPNSSSFIGPAVPAQRAGSLDPNSPDFTGPKPPATNGPKTAQESALAIQQAQQRIALLGLLATVEDQVRAKQLEIDAAALNGVGISKSQADAVLLVTRAQVEMTRVGQQASIGIYDQAAAQKAANDQLQALIQQKLIDPANTQQMTAAQISLGKAMRDTSDAAKVAGSNFPQLQQALNDVGNASKQLDGLLVEGMNVNRSFYTDIAQNVRNGASAFDALGKAGLNALGKITDKLLGMAADQVFAKAFGGTTGGGLMSLLGLGGGSGLNANGSIIGAVGPTSVGGAPLVFDGGGFTGTGGKYQPAGIVHRDEYVFDQDSTRGLGVAFLDRLRRTAKGYAGGGLAGGGSTPSLPFAPAGPQPLDVKIGVTVDDDGKFRAYVKSVSAQSAGQVLGSYVGSEQHVQHIALAYREAKQRVLV